MDFGILRGIFVMFRNNLNRFYRILKGGGNL